jgi:hypothetical protein
MAFSSDNLRHVELQERDIALLRGLFESRVMSLAHIAAIHFEGRKEAAQKRVQKLKAAGYLTERPRRPYEPSLLFITRHAFLVLQKAGQLARYPSLDWSRLRKRLDVSPYTLAHETAVLDVKAAFITAAAQFPQLSIREFSTWPAMFQFKAAPRPGLLDILVKPDGFIRLDEALLDGSARNHSFFLEVDRSTEPQGTLVLRAACYRNYHRRGSFAKQFDDASSPAAPSFRVLFVCKTAQRRDNTAQRLLLLQPPILSQVWLTTQDEITRDPLGPIWLRPMDFRGPTPGCHSDRDIAFNAANQRPLGSTTSVADRLPKLHLLSPAFNAPVNARLDLSP